MTKKKQKQPRTSGEKQSRESDENPASSSSQRARIQTRSTGTSSLTITHRPEATMSYQSPVPPPQGTLSYPSLLQQGDLHTPNPPSMPSSQGAMSCFPSMLATQPASYLPLLRQGQSTTSYLTPIGTMSYPLPLPAGQSTASFPSSMPPAQGGMSYPLSMLVGQSTASFPSSMPPAQEAMSYPLSMLVGQSTASNPSPMSPTQGLTSYPLSTRADLSSPSNPSPMLPTQALTSYPLSTRAGQSSASNPFPMPPAQGTRSYHFPMLPGLPDQMSLLPPVPAQDPMSNLPQVQPGHAALPYAPRTLPTAFTTPSADSQTTPWFNGPSFVWGIRIPGDNSPIERMVIEIVVDQHKPTDHVPWLKEWWPETDPTAQPLSLTLDAQLELPPLAGYYVLFTRLDATNIPRNHHMGHRICGDAFLLRINALRCHPETVGEDTKFHSAIYEDVPEELTCCYLLDEILKPILWKTVAPYSSVVRLGLVRAQMRQEEKERWMEEEEEKKEREEMLKEQEGLVQRKREQMGKHTREWEQQKEQSKREQQVVDQRRRDQKVKTTGNRKEKKRLQSKESNEKETQDRERQERERQEGERRASMASIQASAAELSNGQPSQEWAQSEQRGSQERTMYEGASSGEELVGLPYELGPRTAATPNQLFGEPNVFTSIAGLVPDDVSEPSIEELQASSNNSELWYLNTPEPSFGESYASTPIHGTAHQDVHVSLFEEQQASTTNNQPGLLDPPELSFEEQQASTPIFRRAPYFLPQSSFEMRYPQTSPNRPAPQDTPGLSFEEHNGFSPIKRRADDDRTEPSPGKRQKVTGIYGAEP